MPELSPALIRVARSGRIALALAGGCALAGLFLSGCMGAAGGAGREVSRLYPPPPQTARAVALGTLRGTPPPTAAEVDLSLFLFGAEPAPSLAIANPTGLVVRGQSVLVCDNALSTVLRCDAGAAGVEIEPFSPPLLHPFAIDLAPNGDLLVCDREGVKRFDPQGKLVQTYVHPASALKPGGVLAVEDTVWVTNIAAHRIEIFDTAGTYLRSIGGPGHEPGRFALPRGLARTPDGQVCVVDMLENRVQVFDSYGQWIRNIGQSGDSVGCFGRAKDVAVGPDGTVFVTDDFSQRVHAFTLEGQPLLAFGEPGASPGALALPSGIAISTSAPRTDFPVPAELTPAYYVLVAEQLDRPGVRVYAWLPGAATAAAAPMLAPGVAQNWRPRFPGSVAINPHWDAERCTKCHQTQDDRMSPIPAESVDALCISCHDGDKAPADPHPIGRPAVTDLVSTPGDWPTANGAIGCLTCHDIQRHCFVGAKRPGVNSVLLRAWDPQRPLEYCGNCHHTDVGGRFSPHRQRAATGEVRVDACLFCHTQRPEIPDDGRRRFEPHLRVQTSDLCLNCHSKHWDLSPRGHVDRPVTPAVRQWLLMRQLSTEVKVSRQELARLAENPQLSPALLPLGHREVATDLQAPRTEELVTCYSCHNPHYKGLFPADSELGALAANPVDRRAALRLNWIDLCSECHYR